MTKGLLRGLEEEEVNMGVPSMPGESISEVHDRKEGGAVDTTEDVYRKERNI